MPSVAVGLPDACSSPAISAALVFIMTVLLPMGFFSCRRCADVFCCTLLQNLVECRDGGLDVFALENIRGKKAKDPLAGSIENDASLHHLGGHLCCQFGGVEFEAQHQAESSDVDDA